MTSGEVDCKATREFALTTILIKYCGQMLLPTLIVKILEEMATEMQSGPTAWAFSGSKVAPAPTPGLNDVMTGFAAKCGLDVSSRADRKLTPREREAADEA